MAKPIEFPAAGNQGRTNLARITVPEIAMRLGIGRLAVYSLLEQGKMPGIRLRRRWIVTRSAYERWERTCGMEDGAGLTGEPEVTVWTDASTQI